MKYLLKLQTLPFGSAPQVQSWINVPDEELEGLGDEDQQRVIEKYAQPEFDRLLDKIYEPYRSFPTEATK